MKTKKIVYGSDVWLVAAMRVKHANRYQQRRMPSRVRATFLVACHSDITFGHFIGLGNGINPGEICRFAWIDKNARLRT